MVYASWAIHRFPLSMALLFQFSRGAQQSVLLGLGAMYLPKPNALNPQYRAL